MPEGRAGVAMAGTSGGVTVDLEEEEKMAKRRSLPMREGDSRRRASWED